ncbi:MAG TPA: FAD-dependent oxidoreductase [Gemmatimonadaceae bacterium]|nr:FAD-dependent oxidoreductase [Gemmatimonadaceae bacterium]
MSRDVTITVDGRPIVAPEGTTLASAMLGAGITQFRTSVTGEARAPVCGMGVCFECRVTVDGRPHQRSCLIPCADGLRVETAPNDVGAWAPEAERERVVRACDVAVIGGGPAGIAAASAAAEAGARVIVIDHGLRPGGQIWRHRDPASLPNAARAWIARSARPAANGGPKPEWLARTTVFDASAGDDIALRLTGDGAAGAGVVRARRVVIATGARELFLPFPGWTLPGVMGLGGAQALLKGGMAVRGRRAVVAGSGPLLLPVAAALAHAGARVACVVEQAPLAEAMSFGAGLWSHPAKALQALRYGASLAGTRIRFGTWVASADGDGGRVARLRLTDGRRARTVPCDLLCCSYGFVPNVELARLMGCDIERGRVSVDAAQRTSVSGVWCAGEPTGVAGEGAALVEGQIAGYDAGGADALAQSAHLQRARDGWRRFGDRLTEAFRPRGAVRALAADETLVCRCEDVRRGALDPAWTVRQAKLYTRVTMGPCQGMICGAACASLFGWSAGAVRPPLGGAEVARLG